MSLERNNPVVRRLQSAKGHLQSVVAMVEAGEPCGKVLHQLNAVQAALHAAARLMINEQLRESQKTIQYSDCSQERGQALERLILLYQILTRFSYSLNSEQKHG